MVTPTEDYYSDHDGGKLAPIEATTVATWKARAFLENLAIDAEGAVFVTVYSHNRIDRYDPTTRTTTTFAEVPAPPMGLAFDASGVLWTTGGTLYEGPGYIWRVERSGAVRQWCELPDALLMNGCTMHPNGRTLLACESSSGHILAIDLDQPGRWDVWLQGGRLRSIVPKYPGSNGIKIREGWAWISVSGRRLMVRVPIQPDGSAGAIEIAATRLRPTTSRSECPVRSISPRIPNTLWFASTPQALAQHWQAPNRVWSEARLAHSEERAATKRRSM